MILSGSRLSIFQKTFIELFDLNREQLESIFSWAQSFQIMDINQLSDKDIYSLMKIQIYPSDSVDILLSFTMEYYTEYFNDHLFDILIIQFKNIIESHFDISLKLKLSNNPILNDKFILSKLRNFPFLEEKLPINIVDFMQKHPYMRIPDLGAVSENHIISFFSFSFKSLSLIRSIREIPDIFKEEAHGLKLYFKRTDIWSSMDKVLYEWIMPIVKNNDTYYDIIFSRLFSKKDYTLEHLAKKYNLSKERIRQIVLTNQNKMSKKINLEYLEPLWTIIEALAKKYKVISINNLCQKINIILNWQEGIRPKALKNLISIYKSNIFFICECSKSNTFMMVYNNLQCKECSIAGSFLKTIVKKQQYIKATDLTRVLSILCKENCVFYNNTRYSKDLCIYFYRKHNKELQSIVFKDSIFFTKDSYKLYKSSINSTIEYIMRKSKKPMTINEIYQQIIKYKNKKSSLVKLRHIIYGNKDYLSWKRGKYIHIDHIVINEDFLNSIEHYLFNLKSSQKDSFISIKEVYKVFADKAKQAGIPNTYALYSCLKHRSNPHFSFNLYPYIQIN